MNTDVGNQGTFTENVIQSPTAKPGARLTHIEIPGKLHRNSPGVIAAGWEHTGKVLIDYAMSCLGLETLEDSDVLDVGCGPRFTLSLINRKIPIKSYTGIDVEPKVTQYLKDHVENYDTRFRYAHWDVHNKLYRPTGHKITGTEPLPFPECYDVIWLFSVFTHFDPTDSLVMLQILRRYLRAQGKLFFTTFIDESMTNGFEDRSPEDKPLAVATYSRQFMESLIQKTGWTIEQFYPANLSLYIQAHYVCSLAID